MRTGRRFVAFSLFLRHPQMPQGGPLVLDFFGGGLLRFSGRAARPAKELRWFELMPAVATLQRDNLRRERLGPRDLRAALRHHGVISIRDIRYAFLEEDGHVSVITGRSRGG